MDLAEFDFRMMQLACATGRRGLGQTAPNPAVGAVLANSERREILARAVTARGGRPHAEPQVLDAAGTLAEGATLYVTLEPCSHHGETPPCVERIIVSGVSRVVVGVQDPDKRVAGRGLAQLKAAGIAVQSGVCGAEAGWLSLGHALRVTKQRPFVQLKLAMDQDGTIPRGQAGKPTMVTSVLSRAAGHALRATSDAILIGGATLRDDNPTLTCRLPGLEARSPIRIVVTSKGGAIKGSALYASRTEAPVWLGFEDGSGTRLHEVSDDAGLSDASGHGAMHVADLLADLAGRGVTRLLVEGGPVMWQWFASIGLVDEIVAFVAGTDCHGPGADKRAQGLVGTQIGRDPGPVQRQRNFKSDAAFTFRPGWQAGWSLGL